MSIKVMSRVWEHSKASGGDLLVLLALADFSNDEGESFPGIARIAQKSRLKERATQMCLVRLVGQGEIRVCRNEGLQTKGGFTNKYVILTGANNAPRDIDGGAVNDAGGAFSDQKGVHSSAPKPSVQTVSSKTVSTFDPSKPEQKEGQEKEKIEKREKPAENALFDYLPGLWGQEWDLVDAWVSFVDMRKRIKEPLTEKAIQLIAGKLKTYGLQGAIASLNESIMNNWKGVFPLKNGNGKAPEPEEPQLRRRADGVIVGNGKFDF